MCGSCSEQVLGQLLYLCVNIYKASIILLLLLFELAFYVLRVEFIYLMECLRQWLGAFEKL